MTERPTTADAGVLDKSPESETTLASSVLAVGDFDGQWKGQRSTCYVGKKRHWFGRQNVTAEIEGTRLLFRQESQVQTIRRLEGTISPEGVVVIMVDYEDSAFGEFTYEFTGDAVTSNRIEGTWRVSGACDEGEWDLERE